MIPPKHHSHVPRPDTYTWVDRVGVVDGTVIRHYCTQAQRHMLISGLEFIEYIPEAVE